MIEWALILIVGVASGTLGGVVGFGASLLLMPVLIFAFGAKAAVPIMAIGGLFANVSRAAIWWREIDWRVTAVYSLPALPAAALGASLLVSLDAHLVEIWLGLFFIAMIPLRRILMARGFKLGLGSMAVVGAVIGLITGVVAATGPINTPFFLAYGLVKGAYLATEAAASVSVSLSKLATFRTLGALPQEAIVRGLLVGSSITIGSWLAKRIVLRMDASQFRVILEALMAVAGVTMIASGLNGGGQ